MQIAEVQLERAGAGEAAAELAAIYGFLGALRKSGQVLRSDSPMVEAVQGYRVFLTLPREDSMDHRHDSEHVREYYQRLAEASLSASVIVLGKVPDSSEPCTCSERDSFILFTTFISLESPLRCGACRGPVPLYEIPPACENPGELHHEIIGWQSDYQACDMLQMGCATGERFGLREMERHDSSLSRRGRELCRQIEAATGTPAYYYLHRYREKRGEDERDRKCPACGGEWLLSEPLHDLFDFKCEPCRLLSNIAFAVQGR